MTMYDSLTSAGSSLLLPDRDSRSRLGHSFNTPASSTGQLVVEAESYQEQAGIFEQDAVLLTSFHELRRFLSISTRAKGNIYGFKFRGSSDYVERRRTRKYSLYAAISVFSGTEVHKVDGAVALRDGAWNDLPNNGEWTDGQQMKNYHEKWGDAFIKESLFGGEAVVIVEITEESYSEYKNFLSSFRGSYAEVNSGSARYQKTKELLQSFKQVHAQTFVRGAPHAPPMLFGATDQSATYDVNALFQYLDNFDGFVKSGAARAMVGFQTDTLKETSNWPANLPAFDIETPLLLVDNINNQILEMARLSAQWDVFVRNPNLYDLARRRAQS